MTAVRFDPATGSTRLASQPGPETLVWDGGKWVSAWVCGACRRPGIKHKDHPHCEMCVKSYSDHEKHIAAHVAHLEASKMPVGSCVPGKSINDTLREIRARALPATESMSGGASKPGKSASLMDAIREWYPTIKEYEAIKAREAALAKDLNQSIYEYEVKSYPAMETRPPGIPGREASRSTPGTAKACPKCKAMVTVGAVHDREECFGRWLSTPRNDPPARFVPSEPEPVTRKTKFKVGEKVVMLDLQGEGSSGVFGTLVQVMQALGGGPDDNDYCVVSLEDEGVRHYVDDHEIRRPTVRELKQLAKEKCITSANGYLDGGRDHYEL